MPREVIDTVAFAKAGDHRVVMRKYDTRMVTVEMDLDTLSDLGLEVKHLFDRKNSASYLEVTGTNFQWRQDGARG